MRRSAQPAARECSPPRASWWALRRRQDAVRRARELPQLRVGLHLVLADGFAVLPREQIPDLVDEQGRFGDGMWLDGVRYFALPSLRRQLEAEIRAQFAAFARTGLVLDHVNAHKHFHLAPYSAGNDCAGRTGVRHECGAGAAVSRCGIDARGGAGAMAATAFLCPGWR